MWEGSEVVSQATMPVSPHHITLSVRKRDEEKLTKREPLL